MFTQASRSSTRVGEGGDAWSYRQRRHRTGAWRVAGRAAATLVYDWFGSSKKGRSEKQFHNESPIFVEIVLNPTGQSIMSFKTTQRYFSYEYYTKLE